MRIHTQGAHCGDDTRALRVVSIKPDTCGDLRIFRDLYRAFVFALTHVRIARIIAVCNQHMEGRCTPSFVVEASSTA
jgi:hypothetical protein